MLECKYNKLNVLAAIELELIDTCWNVNTLKNDIDNVDAGINRYMLECKYLTLHFCLFLKLLELIDTCWNVNFLKEELEHVEKAN